MNVVITGGTGFIGKHLVNELINRGEKVTILTSHFEKIHNASSLYEIVYTTYRYDDLIKKLDGRKFDVFYHLAWAGVDSQDKNNIMLQYSNIQMSIDMMHISKQLGCKVFVGVGTVAEYAFNKNVIDFSMKQTPNDMYGATKVAVHYLLESVAKQIKQNMIWAVLPSTFGEGRKGNNIITYTINMLINGKRPLYGNLEQMWDFLYVTEVARALALIGEKGRYNMTYGIGSGEYRTLKDYICTIRDMIDPELELGIGERKVDVSAVPLSSCVNIEQLTKDTGFLPEISFEEGMKRTIRYYKENKNG